MVNVVMIARNRPGLTEQALRSLRQHTTDYNLTVVDDGSRETHSVRINEMSVDLHPGVGIVGFLKNFGAQVSEKVFGRGEWLYFSDNDVCFLAGWLENMIDCLTVSGMFILGGCRHPFHQPISRKILCEKPAIGLITECTDAVAGYSMLMSWKTWDTYGPFDAHAKGTGQSEDWALCRKVVEAGYKVGYVSPPCLVNCGLTDTNGNKVVGYDQIKAMVPEGVIAE